MQAWLRDIESADRRYGLFGRGDRILIALSGGPDSVALFHLLFQLASKYELSLGAAHLNHRLRPEAPGDQRFCRMLCRAHGIRFHTRSVDVRQLARQRKIGIEEAGRRARYDFFGAVCETYSYNKVAIGHTADDNAETFLLNLARGAGVTGLSGIPPRRDSIIRPLIEFGREDILEFLRTYALSYREDVSNAEDLYRRNIIRNRVIPGLRQINPRVPRNIARATQLIRESLGLIDERVGELYRTCLVSESASQIRLDHGKLAGYDSGLGKWIVLKAYFQLSDKQEPPDSDQVIQAAGLRRPGSVSYLGGDVIVSCHAGQLILSRPAMRIGRIKLRKGETVELKPSDLAIRIQPAVGLDADAIRRNKDESVAYVDGSKVGDLVARSAREGDRFRPLGLGGTKKLFEFLNERGVARVFRRSIPVVTSGGQIIWVAGYGIDDRFKVTEMTKEILRLELLKGTGR